MMNDLFDRTHMAISRLQTDEAERDALRQVANNYFNECGCAMGSFFLIAAIAGLILEGAQEVRRPPSSRRSRGVCRESARECGCRQNTRPTTRRRVICGSHGAPLCGVS